MGCGKRLYLSTALYILSRQNSYLKFIVSAFGFSPSLFYSIGCSQYHTQPAMSYYLRFTEDTYLYSFFFENLLKVTKHHLIGIALYHNSSRCRWPEEAYEGIGNPINALA